MSSYIFYVSNGTRTDNINMISPDIFFSLMTKDIIPCDFLMYAHNKKPHGIIYGDILSPESKALSLRNSVYV